MTPTMLQPKDKPYEPLGKRELEILSLMAQNLSDRIIAERLVVAYTTVKWYNRQIFNKLGVNNRHEAIEAARAFELLAAQEPQVTPRHNLPSQMTPFVGRETEMHDLVHMLRDQDSRLVTLLAPGGMGKTRLSLAVAEKLLSAFPDGVTFVSLAPLKSSADLVSTIASQVGYQFQPNNRTPAQQLLDYFSPKKALLLLDNFEHLLDAAPFVVDLLQNAPELRILVTSREKLSLSGEIVYTLDGLDYPSFLDEDILNYSAIQLFIQCAYRARPAFNPDDKLADIIQICKLVSGLPLAIELAAAWVEVLPPAEIATEISASLDFLSSTLRDLPERQRSVRAVFESTWKRLTEQERTAFMRLSVFRGGCTRRAAQSVAGVGLQTLTALADKALVSWSTATERYVIHELLRQYAANALEQAGEANAVRTAHSSYYGAAMAEREPYIKGEHQLEALTDIAADLDNVTAGLFWALQQGHDAVSLQYIKTLGLFYQMVGRIQEAVVLWNESLSILEHRSQPVNPLLLGWVLGWQSHYLNFFIPGELGQAALERSLAIAREQKDRSLQAFCLRGMISVGEGSEPFVREAVAISRELHDPFMTALYLTTLGYIAGSTHHMDDCLRMNTEASVIRREIGDFVGLGLSLNNLADYHQRLGNWEEAERCVTECLSLNRKMGSTNGIEISLANHTLQLLFHHDLAKAEMNIRDSLSLVRESGHRTYAVGFWYQASLLRLIQGNYDEAYAFAGESLEEALKWVAADHYAALYPRIALGCSLIGRCEYDAAIPHLIAGLPHADDAPSENVSQRYVVTGIAHYYAYAGEPERALELISTTVHNPLSPKWWASEEPLTVRLLTELKAALSPPAYDNAWQRGKQTDFDAAFKDLIAHIPE
jgi:predicted ATPase/DNA-binding CsgD family transcriptional regulator